MRKRVLFIFILLVICNLQLAGGAWAKEITILYTGQTHAMLYPCNCPKNPDGGVARRAALIKQLRKSYPHAIVLDSGSFFAGGLMDSYTQNTELDMQRSIVDLKAMELMKYDALAIGDDEFNFGRDFFTDNIKKTNLVFLSCNTKADKILPYIIKEVAGVKVGIIGVTNPSASQKAGGFKFSEPKAAVRLAVSELKGKGVDVIVLLSRLGESEDASLANEVKGINIIITTSGAKEEAIAKTNNATVILRPSWQGRSLGKLSLIVENNKIKECRVEELRLSDKIGNDKEVAAILPACFSDGDCRKKGFIGTCQDAGKHSSRCLYSETSRIKLSVIVPRPCIVCDTSKIVDFLEKQFPGLVVSYLYYPGAKAQKLVKDLGIRGLPVYLLDKDIEKEAGFSALRKNLEAKGGFYMLKPQATGISHFVERDRIRGKLDLFISLFDKRSAELLGVIKEFRPSVHFLAVERLETFDAAGGNLEVEECLRSVCVQKYYPGLFWGYISCRAKNKDSSWWEDCLGAADASRIKTCARGPEGKALLRENTKLTRELQIMFGPVYLVDNQEIFSSENVPSREEFKKIFK